MLSRRQFTKYLAALPIVGTLPIKKYWPVPAVDSYFDKEEGIWKTGKQPEPHILFINNRTMNRENLQKGVEQLISLVGYNNNKRIVPIEHIMKCMCSIIGCTPISYLDNDYKNITEVTINKSRVFFRTDNNYGDIPNYSYDNGTYKTKSHPSIGVLRLSDPEGYMCDIPKQIIKRNKWLWRIHSHYTQTTGNKIVRHCGPTGAMWLLKIK